MPNRARDWLSQAEKDLAHAEDSRRLGAHEWACFATHQAAEKAVKALHLHHGQQVWGHVLSELLEKLPGDVEVPPELIEKAQVLDNYYLPPRYPNGHPSGAPFEHYGALQSKEGIRYAREVVGFVRLQMA